MKVSEPAIAYDSLPLQQLRTRLVETIGMENRIVKLQQCLDLLQSDDEDMLSQEQAYLDAIDEETKRMAVNYALADYRDGKCTSQHEMSSWLKDRMGWK